MIVPPGTSRAMSAHAPCLDAAVRRRSLIHTIATTAAIPMKHNTPITTAIMASPTSSTRHGAPHATAMVNTTTALIDATSTPEITDIASGTALETVPTDIEAERELIVQRAEDVVRRLQQLEAHAEQIQADNADAETRASAIIANAKVQADLIITDANTKAEAQFANPETPNSTNHAPDWMSDILTNPNRRSIFRLWVPDNDPQALTSVRQHIARLTEGRFRLKWQHELKSALSSMMDSRLTADHRPPAYCARHEPISERAVLISLSLINQWVQQNMVVGWHTTIDRLNQLIDIASRPASWPDPVRDLVLDSAQGQALPILRPRPEEPLYLNEITAPEGALLIGGGR